jgi:hypothetical protein
MRLNVGDGSDSIATRCPREYPGHDALRRASAGSFQGIFERLASGPVQIGWMPLASIRPRNLWALRIRFAARNTKLCSFGKIYVIGLSERVDQRDGYRYGYYRTDAGGNKFVRQHGSLPKRLSNPIQRRYMLALNTGCAR